MKMRLMGASSEMQEVGELLQIMFDVHSVSKDYPNRGNSTAARVYVDLDIPIRNALEKDAIKIVADFRNELSGSFMIFNKGSKIDTAYAANDNMHKLYLLMFLNSDVFSQMLNERINELDISTEFLEYAKKNFIKEEAPKC